jgi:hypothetical protein
MKENKKILKLFSLDKHQFKDSYIIYNLSNLFVLVSING